MSETIADQLAKFNKNRKRANNMGTRPNVAPGATNDSMSIKDTISKCLVVFFLKKVNVAEVASTKFMDSLLGVSPESIKQLRPFQPPSDGNILAIFVEMISTELATFVACQWQINNTDKNILLMSAADFLCHVAGKKFQKPGFDNAESAFHGLFKPNALSALFFQQPRQVSIQGHPSTAPVHPLRDNPFQHLRPQFSMPSSSTHQQLPNNVYTSGGGHAHSYPLSAPLLQGNFPSAQVSMPQPYFPPNSMFSSSLNNPYQLPPHLQQPQQIPQQQQYQPTSYFPFPPNTSYGNPNYPNNQGGYY